MRTLHFGLRVADLDRSLAFYTAVGYEVVGTVPGTAIGDLTTLKLPGDEHVMIELVSGPSFDAAAGGLSHFVVKVESLAATTAELATAGIDVAAPDSPDGTEDFLTTWITDPDGNRIELVRWPAGHADGITAADWPG
jgi:lactoylglutathione lyase